MTIALGALLPPWGLDPDMQGHFIIDSGDPSGSGVLRDVLVTAAVGSAPNRTGDVSLPAANISFINFLLHNVLGTSSNLSSIPPTRLKSDVNVAECAFNNSYPNMDQASADGGQHFLVAKAVSAVSLKRLHGR
jgi:hypothetical protein